MAVVVTVVPGGDVHRPTDEAACYSECAFDAFCANRKKGIRVLSRKCTSDGRRLVWLVSDPHSTSVDSCLLPHVITRLGVVSGIRHVPRSEVV